MAIDISYDNRSATLALERAKRYIDKVRSKKTVYSVHSGNMVMCSTSKRDIDAFIDMVTPKNRKVKEVKLVPLGKVNELRKKMTLGEVIKKLDLDMTVNSLKVALVNAGYIKTNRQISEEREARDKKIKSLYGQGYSFSMIKEALNLSIKEVTIERICKNW